MRLAAAVAFGSVGSGAAQLARPSSLPAVHTIPTIDLSGESRRQIVVDREPGQYLGHPATVLFEDDRTMLIVYPKGHGSGPIIYKRSTDGGLTWSDRLPTPASWATSKETPTLFRVTTADGRKRLLLFSGRQRKFTEQGEKIRLSTSNDDGRTWSELEPIGDFGGITAMSSLVALHGGRLMALFHDSGRVNEAGDFRPTGDQPSSATLQVHYRVFKTLSRDGGLTWSGPAVIARHREAQICEPGALRSPDGRQIAVLLRDNSNRYNSFIVFSDDEGETWTEPREMPAALTGDRHRAAYAPDGRLFISFRSRIPDGHWAAWVGTYEDIAHGREGQYRVRLMNNHKGADCAYPGVEVLRDGTIITTTYGHWTPKEEPYIVSVRLKLSELDGRAPTTQARPGPDSRAPDTGRSLQ